jgi:uncharacterized membrane protein YcaP (DUF421 family)
VSDPIRIVVRVLFVYAWMHLMTRVSGRRTIKHRDPASFVLAVIFGDMFDDVLWGEVSAAQFVVGVGTLVTAQLLTIISNVAAGTREWRRSGAGAQ